MNDVLRPFDIYAQHRSVHQNNDPKQQPTQKDNKSLMVKNG